MRSLLLALLLVPACSSEESKPLFVTDAMVETAADTSAATDTAKPETATPVDSSIPCPGSPPKNGDPCDRPGQKCDYPVDCGPSAGDFATCTAGGWSVVTNPCTVGDTGAG